MLEASHEGLWQLNTVILYCMLFKKEVGMLNLSLFTNQVLSTIIGIQQLMQNVMTQLLSIKLKQIAGFLKKF